MNVCRHLNALTGVGISELSLATRELTIWMQLTEEDLAARAQHSGGFEEHDREVVDVLENEITGHHIDRCGGYRPHFPHIVSDEPDVRGDESLMGARNHALRKIHGDDALRVFGEVDRVLPGSTAELEDLAVLQQQWRLAHDDGVQIARGVLVRVVTRRPPVVGVGNVIRGRIGRHDAKSIASVQV